eukprot:m.72481 g.72481  ORF g.72481 m.72481 type:complete len:153 (+) comp16968_c0_seq1:3-461(+)
MCMCVCVCMCFCATEDRTKTNDALDTLFLICPQHAVPHGPNPRPFYWYYKVTLENLGKRPVQLLSRAWHIVDDKGSSEVQTGRGAVGQFPLLAPNDAVFQYTTYVTVASPRSQMGGTFTFVEALSDGGRGRPFVVEIPTFVMHCEGAPTQVD